MGSSLKATALFIIDYEKFQKWFTFAGITCLVILVAAEVRVLSAEENCYSDLPGLKM
jgi:hypothetical protein